jgi:phosphatidylglycerophosphatase A
VSERPAHTPLDRLAFALGTAGGAGLMPIAPGTWGSAVVTGAVYLLYATGASSFRGASACAWMVGLALALGWAGVWAGGRMAAVLKDDDPSPVVVDEVVGQLLTYSLLPAAGREWTGWSFEVALVVGFFLFRALDIVKPGPVDDLQRFHGGLGIMADDFLAGIVGGWAMLVGTLLL